LGLSGFVVGGNPPPIVEIEPPHTVVSSAPRGVDPHGYNGRSTKSIGRASDFVIFVMAVQV
jgi:hypothetical protein